MKRGGFGEQVLVDVLREVQSREISELQRAHGRIDARGRFKGHSGHPLLEQRPIMYLYLDESGKSVVEPVTPSFFSLAGVAIEDDQSKQYCRAADEIKSRFFGTTEVTFHEPSMRQFDGIYFFGGDTHRQREFDDAIDGLIEATEFAAFGVGVRKTAFEKDFVAAGVDPYLPTDAYSLTIVMLLERFIDFLADRATPSLGRAVFESQGPREDAYHQLEYARTLLEGSQWVSDSAFRNWLEAGLRFTPKRGSDPTELSDMLSRDLYEWIRDDCNGSPKRWSTFSKKIYCRDDGAMGKFGIKVFPDSDIRDRIEAHRQACGAKVAIN